MKTGILLINLGSPDATDFRSVRRYLKQFLSDKRVIEARGPLWWLVFHGIILTRRPKSAGRAYASIWNRSLDESPLKVTTRAQAGALASRFAHRPDVVVEWAMRYGAPSIDAGITALTAQDCARIVLFPLYPQYSASTTATALDCAYDSLKRMRNQPGICTVPPYFDHPDYIAALADRIRTHHAGLDWVPEITLASFHGVPRRFVTQGDPYQTQVEITTSLLRKALGLTAAQMPLTYQSRSRRIEWLTPETEATLQELARSGVQNLSVVAPGFAADCLETLEELQIRAAKVFLDAGGTRFTMVPALNDTPRAIDLLETLIRAHI